ncbi:putative hydrolase C9G1.08c [Metarhizium anisopliae]|nr:putative hydrolase C9G1.08c [Metarhizium anisopliae]
MPPRIPTQADFSPLSSTLPLALHFPSPPESTTALLILFHGLGDSETPFASFARNLNLPGVLAISVRGTRPLPPSLVDDSPLPAGHFHWGDDIALDQSTGELDPDPGFARASGLVVRELIEGVLVDKCGWEMGDVLLFGFGQGGSLALGMAAQLAAERVVDVSASGEGGRAFKGVVSIGGGLPGSMVSARRDGDKSDTHVLACQVDGDMEDGIRQEFKNVQVVRWGGGEVRMPRDRGEVLPVMRFFADRLTSGWP